MKKMIVGVSVFWALLFGLYQIFNFYQMKIHWGMEQPDLDVFLAYNAGYLNLKGIRDILPLLTWMIYPLSLTYCTGEDIAQDFGRRSDLIFSRYSSRGKWFVKKVLILALKTVLAVSVYGITLIILGLLQRYPWSGSAEIGMLFLLNFLFLYMLQLLINVVALFMKPIRSFFFIWLLLLLNWVIPVFMRNENILKFLPVAQGVYVWHSNIFHTGGALQEAEAGLLDFSTVYSCIYLLVALGIIFAVGLIRVKKMDLIERGLDD